MAASGWSAFREVASVAGTSATARLLRPTPDTALVVDSGPGVPTIATVAMDSTSVSLTARPLAACGAGADPSVSAVSATTWWVACEGQPEREGAETVALTTDGGETYTDASPPAQTGLQQQVTALSASTAYLSGGPQLLVTTDGGQSWSRDLREAGLATPHIPAGEGGQDIWVVQSGTATVWRTTGGGVWTGLRLR